MALKSLIEIPYRNRRWTTDEIQEFLTILGHAGEFGPDWRPGAPWGPEVQPVMRALGERGAFGPNWVVPPTVQEAPYVGWRRPIQTPAPEPKPEPPKPEPPLEPAPAEAAANWSRYVESVARFEECLRKPEPPKPAPAPQPAPIAAKPPEPAPKPKHDPYGPPRKPNPPKVSLWDVTAEQEAAFIESAARALPLSLFDNEAIFLALAEESRFQGNLARIAAMRARRNLSNFDLGQFADDRAIHVVGWNKMGRLAAERVQKERLLEVDD